MVPAGCAVEHEVVVDGGQAHSGKIGNRSTAPMTEKHCSVLRRYWDFKQPLLDSYLSANI